MGARNKAIAPQDFFSLRGLLSDETGLDVVVMYGILLVRVGA